MHAYLGVMPPGWNRNVDPVKAVFALGAAWYRPLDVSIDDTGDRADILQAKERGLLIALTVRVNTDGPSVLPKSLTEYENKLTTILKAYKPQILVVENEVNFRHFWGDTAENYLLMLAAAKRVAHKRRPVVKVTDGGLVSSLVLLLVCEDLLNAGREEDALSVIQLKEPGITSERALRNLLLGQSKQIAFGKAILSGVKQAKLDYANLHFYIPNGEAIVFAVEYMQRSTGLDIMAGEVGQQDSIPGHTEIILKGAIDAGLYPIVFFGMDGFGEEPAYGLIDENGLRPTGVAYKRVADSNYGIGVD